MPLSWKDRKALARQLFQAIAEVGFLTWQAQYREDYHSLLADQTPQQPREHYCREFEKIAWAEIQEMARTAPIDRLTATLDDWRKHAEVMQRDSDLALKERRARNGKASLSELKRCGAKTKPRAKARDTDMER